MADFGSAFQKTLGLEGGYADDAADPGGKTRYGITEAVARTAGYRGDMRSLPLSLAQSIYRASYWTSLRLDDLKSQELAEELFDTAVNCGVSRAGKFLQRALNVLNDGGQRWHDVLIDGKVGPKTIRVANTAAATERHRARLLKTLNVLQGAHYVTLAERRPEMERFLGGWLDKRVVLP